MLGADSGTYTPQDVERKRRWAEILLNGQQPAKEPFGALAQGLRGVLAGTNDFEAGQAEAAGRKTVAELLSGKDYAGAMGNEWASPQQLALASTLQGRDWQVGDRNAQWAREDQRAAQARADAAAAANRPEFKMFEAGGDQYRYNANDPNSRPELFFDGPAQVPDPFTLGENDTRFAGDGSVIATGMPKTPDTIINNGGADDEFYSAAAKARGQQFVDLETAGMNAQNSMGQISRLESLLSSSPQGMEGALKQFAGELGISTEGLDSIQSAQALINKLVPQQRQPGTGPMSDADLALFKQSLPRIINSPGGNAQIVQTLKGIAVYDQQMGDIASKVLNKELTPAQGREQMKALPNPLEMFRGSDKAPGGAPEGVDPGVWAVMTPQEKALWD